MCMRVGPRREADGKPQLEEAARGGASREAFVAPQPWSKPMHFGWDPCGLTAKLYAQRLACLTRQQRRSALSPEVPTPKTSRRKNQRRQEGEGKHEPPCTSIKTWSAWSSASGVDVSKARLGSRSAGRAKTLRKLLLKKDDEASMSEASMRHG